MIISSFEVNYAAWGKETSKEMTFEFYNIEYTTCQYPVRLHKFNRTRLINGSLSRQGGGLEMPKLLSISGYKKHHQNFPMGCGPFVNWYNS